MTLNHDHTIYDNFVLANEIEDQYNSHLDLVRFCTVDNSLVGVAGDTKKIHVYRATNGTEKLAMGEGNTKNIEVSYAPDLSNRIIDIRLSPVINRTTPCHPKSSLRFDLGKLRYIRKSPKS